MIHSRLLRYIDEVAATGSMRKASERLNVAASAINRRILAAEAALGAPLFERLHKRLRLTAAGEMVVAHVRQTLRDEQRLRAGVEELKGLRRGHVTIATMLTLAGEVLPAIIHRFREKHPKATVHVKVLRDIEETVAADGAELGFGFNLAPHPALTTHASAPLKFGAIVAPTHPLARRRQVTLASCVSYPLILPEGDMSIRPDLDRAFASLKGSVDVAIETNAIELIKRAAALQIGIGFLTPIPVRQECERGELVYLPLRDRLPQPQRLIVVRRTQGHFDGLVGQMAEMLRAAIEQIGQDNRMPALKEAESEPADAI